MDILLVDRLVPEALAWLQERYGVESRGDLAADPSALRKAVSSAVSGPGSRPHPVTSNRVPSHAGWALSSATNVSCAMPGIHTA